MEHEIYMREAVNEAKKAFELDETPIGAVIVQDGKIIGRGYNRRNSEKNPLCHAEIIAINEAAKYIGDWRIENCTIYVTVEPCPMCAGAIVQARIPTVVFGTENVKAGCCGSVLNLMQQEKLNHRAEVISDVLKEECSSLMKEFFKNMRKKRLG
ncbi:tRNA adenosine(34) deaminase TadA [Anaerotignum faecicola]|nr:tRNA adenosine(34) deaminase TadA [Anaerotignum faecicola]